MKILFVAAYDSMNYTLAECAQEAKNRGHTIFIVVKNKADQNNNRMFESKNLKVIPIKEFNFNCLDSIDLVISAPVSLHPYRKLFSEIRSRKIFFVSFASLFSSIVMREYPDLVLCLGYNKFKEFRENQLQYNCIAIGNPQYDPLVARKTSSKESKEIKKVLIVDQGGYPYGKKGKQQLADTLIKIAEQDPDRQYMIKPRYAKKANGQTTHFISENLIDFLHCAPPNLTVLDGDRILEEILTDYDAMITTWSTAYLDAIVCGLPLVLIEGLDSIDVFDVRTERVAKAYSHLKKTGCVRNFKELQQSPISFSLVSPVYEEQEIYNSREKCTEKVVELFEYLYDQLIIKNMRINQHIEMGIEDFYNQFNGLDFIDLDSDIYEKKYTFLCQFNEKMQEWVYLNRCMGNVLDLSDLYTFFSYDGSGRQANIELKEVAAIFKGIRDDYFSSENNKSLISNDRILQDFYFDWLYDTKQYSLLINPDINVTAPESLAYNRACAELKRKNRKQAYAFLEQFLNYFYNRKNNIVQLLKEKRLPQCLIYFCKETNVFSFLCFLIKGKHLRILMHFNNDLISNYSIPTFWKMKYLTKAGALDECQSLYIQYKDKHQKQSGGMKGKIKNVINSIIGIPIMVIYKKNKR